MRQWRLLTQAEKWERIAPLWAEGLSASKIGERAGCSRCAVLGVVHRVRDKGVQTDRPARPRSPATIANAYGFVTYSPFGLDRLRPRQPDRVGRIIRYRDDGAALVVWNGGSEPYAYSPRFLQSVPEVVGP